MGFDPAWEKAHAERPWGRWPNEHFVRFVAQHFPKPGASFIELGCGAGAQLHFLAQEGHQAIGYDGSASAVERARKRTALDCEVEAVIADILDMPAHGWQVDCVVDVACLQYLSGTDALAVIRKAKTWLKPGGRMFSLMAANGSSATVHTIGRVRVVDLRAVDRLFRGWRTEVGYEEIGRGASREIVRHWIIDAIPGGKP